MLGKNLIQAAAGNAAGDTGRFIAVGNETSPWFRVYERNDDGTVTLKSSNATVYVVNATTFTPEGDYILAAGFSFDGSHRVALFSHNEGSIGVSSTFAAATNARGVAMHPSGNYCVVCQDGSPYIYLLNITNGVLSQATTYTGIAGQVRKASYHPSGNYIAFTSGESVRVLSQSGGSLSLYSSYTSISGTALTAEFSPDGSYVAVSHLYGNQFTMLNGPALSLKSSTAVGFRSNDIRWHPESTFLAMSGLNNGVSIYSVSNGTVSGVTGVGLGEEAYCNDFSPNGEWVLCGANGTTGNFRVFSFDGTTLTQTASVNIDRKVNAARFSPN